ncbi:hypothetical protein KUM39_04355 [Streptomyces sp. J2-1]|uniref:hypothetical protein n=1 Tax=Streptomyces corallincola TaxID=2851888 RepID=UPI001C38ABB3|nr:hypothetical protein [Streptomyces corallincola]MBV2353597.1 hypothetical protein [Streptomyces corallincola]
MTNLDARTPAPADLEGDLASLRGDCARMAPRWPSRHDRETAGSPAPLTGVTVPDRSARLLDSMSDYGD